MTNKFTERELNDYILAIKIVKHAKPLLALDDKLNLYPEITQFEELLENIRKAVPQPYRGQRQVVIEVPQSMQTTKLNKALRYGIPAVSARGRYTKDSVITRFDCAYGIAMANKLIPPQEDISFYRLPDDEE